MKRCPKCNSQYSDVTLSFCLQDGTPLVDVKQSSVDTVAFAKPVTAEKILQTQDFRHVAPANDSPQRDYQYAAFPQPRPPKKSGRGWMIAIASVLLLMIVGAVGVFGWLYLSTQKPALASTKTENHEPYSIAPMNVSAKPTEIVTNDKPAADVSPSPSTGKVNPDAIRREVTADVDGWRRSAEACNANDYAARYGEKIEYHDHHGVPVDEIRHEVQKTCDTFTKIEIKVDNMVVAVDAEGDAATAIFDKEWRYEASPKLAQGKVHMKLHFRKIADGWKIVSEQNLKTYYSRS